MEKALDFALKVLTELPALISSGIDIYELVQKSNEQLKRMVAEKRDPTEAEWDELNASIQSKRNKLHSSE